MLRAPRVGAVIAFVLALQSVGLAAALQTPPPPSPPEAVRAEVTELPCVEPPADGTLVRVVDAAGTPVAGAIVTWFEETPDGFDTLAPEPVLARLRRDSGTSVRSGADGTTRIGRFFRVVASSGDRCSGSWRARRGTPLVLALQPRRSITVRVVDREGRPVSDVGLELRTDEEAGRDGWKVRTGADGRAEIGPIDLYASFDSSAARELWIAVDAPLATPVVQRFTLAELPAQPIELTLPPTGKLVIDIVDAEGQPFGAPGYLSVRGRHEWEEAEAGGAPGAGWPTVRWHDSNPRSHHELPHVELGLRLVVERMDDEETKPVKLFLDGPTKSGETTVAKLVVPPPAPTELVRGRLLDPAGAPLAATKVVLLWNDDESRQGRQLLAGGTTGADGRIEARLDRWARRRFENEMKPWIEAVVLRADGNGIDASGMVALAKTKELRGLDFGEIRLERSPAFASGVVVDDAGAPVVGARLDVTVFPLDAESLSGNFTDDRLTATTGPDGRFTIWGDAPLGNCSIGANPGDVERDVPLWHSSELQELHADRTGLRLVLWRCGTLVAQVVGEPGEVGDLCFSASSLRSDGEEFGGWSGGVDESGTIETDIPIGVAKLELTRGGTVVAVRDGIEVKPGAWVELEPIDLSAAAHQVVLTIVDEAGRPVPEGWIVMPNAEDDARIAQMKQRFGPERAALLPFPRRPDVTLFKEGRITLRSDSAIPAFAVGAAGRAAVVVRHPANAQQIVLEPAPHVAIVLEHEGEPVAAPLHFLVSLTAPNVDEEWFRFGPGRMSDADSLELPRPEGIVLRRDEPVAIPIRCLGKMRLSLVLGEKHATGFSGTTIDGLPAEIDVARSADDQVFRIKVERAAIDTIVKQRAEQK